MPKPVYTYVRFVNTKFNDTKQLIYSHTNKYFQVFLYDISLFSDDSFFYFIISHYYFY